MISFENNEAPAIVLSSLEEGEDDKGVEQGRTEAKSSIMRIRRRVELSLRAVAPLLRRKLKTAFSARIGRQLAPVQPLLKESPSKEENIRTPIPRTSQADQKMADNNARQNVVGRERERYIDGTSSSVMLRNRENSCFKLRQHLSLINK